MADAGPGIDRKFADRGIQSVNLGTISSKRESSQLIGSAAGPSGTSYLLSQGRSRSPRMEIAKFLKNGQLDPEFGLEGISFLNFAEDKSVRGEAIAVDSRGNILITGTTYEKCGRRSCPHVALLRLDRRGNFDPSFRRGKLFKGPLGSGQDLTLLDNGRMLVAGNVNGDFNLSLFKADGSLIRGFGRAGVGTAEAIEGGSSGTAVTGMAFDSKKRILLAASASRGRGYFARFKPNGRADRSFGTSGVFQSGQAAGSRGIEVMKNGRIITAGGNSFWDENCSVLFALTPNGGIDKDFNDAASAATAGTCEGVAFQSVATLTLDRTGNLTVIGRIAKGRFSAQKFAENGTRIASFGAGGIATFPDGTGQVNDGFIDSAGRVIAAGRTSDNAGRIGRFTLSGNPDPAFGTAGSTTYRLVGPSNENATSAFSTGNGVLIAGSSNARTEASSGYTRVAFTHLLKNGKRDRRFGDGGRLITGLISRRNPLADFANGKIFAAGRIEIRGDDDYRAYSAISRFRRNGTPDTSYGTGGTTAETALDGITPDFMVAQPDGGVIVVDEARDGAQIARINPSGRPDRDFGTDGAVNVRIPHDAQASTGIKAVAADSKGRPLLLFYRGICKPDLCGTNEMVIAKFNSRGRPDRSFGNDGQVEGKATSVDAMSVAPDGRVVVAGLNCPKGFAAKCGKRRFILMLKANGRPVAAFGRGGLVTSPVRGMKVSGAAATRSSVVLTGEQRDRPALLGFKSNGRSASGWGQAGLIRLSKGLSGSLDGISGAPGGRLVAVGTLRTSDEADNFLAVGLRSP